MKKETLILYCGCAYSDVVPSQTKAKVLGALEGAGIRFKIVGDLCGAAANEREFLQKAAQENALKVVGCFERAMKWLFEWAGVDTSEIEFYNMRTGDADTIIQSLMGEKVKARPEAIISNPAEWVPWFPVIDGDLCINCKQCMNFCLFGVYTLVDGQVTVTDPAACKINCPACAKVCPKTAIIFPKYDKSPINGDVVDEKSQTCVDISSFMHGDLRKKLLDRSQRFAPASDNESGILHLKDFQEQLDVPQDVIDSLSDDKKSNSALCDNGCKKDNGIDKTKP